MRYMLEFRGHLIVLGRLSHLCDFTLVAVEQISRSLDLCCTMQWGEDFLHQLRMSLEGKIDPEEDVVAKQLLKFSQLGERAVKETATKEEKQTLEVTPDVVSGLVFCLARLNTFDMFDVGHCLFDWVKKNRVKSWGRAHRGRWSGHGLWKGHPSLHRRSRWPLPAQLHDRDGRWFASGRVESEPFGATGMPKSEVLPPTGQIVPSHLHLGGLGLAFNWRWLGRNWLGTGGGWLCPLEIGTLLQRGDGSQQAPASQDGIAALCHWGWCQDHQSRVWGTRLFSLQPWNFEFTALTPIVLGGLWGQPFCYQNLFQSVDLPNNDEW